MQKPIASPRAPLPRNRLPSVLVTGFEAFGDDPSGCGLNPSALLAKALHGKQIAGHRLAGVVLPCVYGQSVAQLQAALAQHRPVLVVCLGQAGGRGAVSIERVAINLDDAPLADNAGIVRQGQRVVPGGPDAYFSTLPVKAMQTAVERAGVACELSSSAGHFVCNHVFYALMHGLAGGFSTRAGVCKTRAGFVHLPYLPAQALLPTVPHMPLATMLRGLRAAIRAALLSG